jgi:hypothetical protein
MRSTTGIDEKIQHFGKCLASFPEPKLRQTTLPYVHLALFALLDVYSSVACYSLPSLPCRALDETLASSASPAPNQDATAGSRTNLDTLSTQMRYILCLVPRPYTQNRLSSIVLLHLSSMETTIPYNPMVPVKRTILRSLVLHNHPYLQNSSVLVTAYIETTTLV